MKKWQIISYSTSGKRIRGFLCMLTFCAFMAGFSLSVIGISEYGSSILRESGNYFDSDIYQRDIAHELRALLNDVINAYESGDGEIPASENFSITDVEAGKIYYYDTLALLKSWQYGNVEASDSLSMLESYKVTEKELSYQFTDYAQALQYMESEDAKNNYLYFSPDAFKELFRHSKHINTDHRYSNFFSDQAYFVFDYIWSDEEEDEEGTGGTLLYQIGWDDVNEEYTRTEVWVDEEGDSVSYRVDSGNYAVYDPEQQLFFSPEDEYFSEMPHYMYRTLDLYDTITDNGYTKDRLDSVVIPLLESYNVPVDEMVSGLAAKGEASVQALARLDERKYRGMLLYDIENSRFHSSNVEDLVDFEEMTAYTYEQGTDEETEEKVDGALDASLLTYYDDTYMNAHILGGVSRFYFGVHTSRAYTEYNVDDSMSWHYRYYSFYSKGIWFFLIGTAAMFLLLMAQAVWLLCTTGRKDRAVREVVLNRFDQLPTELWLLCYAGVLGICLAGVRAYFRVGTNVPLSVTRGILVTVPFAFCFMVLTLSLARRIKARNLWKRLYCRRLLVYVRRRFREFCARRRDTEKLLFLFGLYVLLELFDMLVLYMDGALGLFLFILVQAAAGRVVLGISRDIRIVAEGVSEIASGNLDHKCEVKKRTSPLKGLGDGVNHIGDGLKAAVETSLRDERMKTELITNVSHDLKTPLTSIINYINLLKTEEMPTEEAKHYVEVLDGKAQRLKQLTEDLVEAAKANTGNIELERIPLAFDELMKQAIGEFEDKFADRKLTVVAAYPEQPVIILADGRRMFRIIDNILQNAYKYALEGTRIYADLSREQGNARFVLKNISAAQLNISTDELMERFTRGDTARTTEGSGLGLSIAKDLTALQGGSFEIWLDGDLFKVVITFPEYQEEKIPV